MTNNVWAVFPDTAEASSRTKHVFQWRWPLTRSFFTVFGQICLSQAEGAVETWRIFKKRVNLYGAFSLQCASGKYPSEEENAAVCNGLELRRYKAQKDTE